MKPSFFHNVDLLELSPLHRLLFAGLWCWADREGRLIDRPKQIKHDILPMDEADIDAMLTDLQAKEFIVRYESEGKRLIEISNFDKHQNPHPKESQSLLPSQGEPRISTATRELPFQAVERYVPEMLSPIPSVTCLLSPIPSVSSHADRGMNVTPNQENKTFVDFEDFCHRWNRHKGFKKPTKPVKERAAERWAKIQIDDLDLDLAMDGYYLSEWGKEAGYPMPGFTKNPYSWIPLAAPVDIPAPEVIPINSAEVPLADLPLVLRTDYPARWNELVPAKPVVWDPRRGPEKALRACEEDPVFCEMFDAVCRQAQKIHEVSAPDWLNFEFVIRRSEKGLGWWRVLNEFQGMATPQEKSKVRQTQAQKNSDMVAQYQARLQREIEEEAKQNVAQV